MIPPLRDGKLRATTAILYLLSIAMDAEQIWREKSDEDLAEAGERLSDFTSEGERIIRAELHRRGLPDPPAPLEYCWKCGRGIYADGPDDACGNCGEPLSQAVREKLAKADEPLISEVVYRSRFAHEIELVTAQLEEAGIVAAQGGSRFDTDVRLRYLGIPVLNASEYTVAVAVADASRAREIIEGLPVSHGDHEETPPPSSFDEP
jgi:hypothetical protein